MGAGGARGAGGSGRGARRCSARGGSATCPGRRPASPACPASLPGRPGSPRPAPCPGPEAPRCRARGGRGHKASSVRRGAAAEQVAAAPRGALGRGGGVAEGRLPVPGARGRRSPGAGARPSPVRGSEQNNSGARGLPERSAKPRPGRRDGDRGCPDGGVAAGRPGRVPSAALPAVPLPGGPVTCRPRVGPMPAAGRCAVSPRLRPEAAALSPQFPPRHLASAATLCNSLPASCCPSPSSCSLVLHFPAVPVPRGVAPPREQVAGECPAAPRRPVAHRSRHCPATVFTLAVVTLPPDTSHPGRVSVPAFPLLLTSCPVAVGEELPGLPVPSPLRYTEPRSHRRVRDGV